MAEKLIVFSNNQHIDNDNVVYRSYQDLHKVVSLMLQNHKIYLEFDIQNFAIHKHFNLFDVSKQSIVQEKRLIIFIQTYKRLNIPNILPAIDYYRDGVGSQIYYYSPDHYELYKDDPNIIFIRNKKLVKRILKANNVVEEISKHVVVNLIDKKMWFDARGIIGDCFIGIIKLVGLKYLSGV